MNGETEKIIDQNGTLGSTSMWRKRFETMGYWLLSPLLFIYNESVHRVLGVLLLPGLPLYAIAEIFDIKWLGFVAACLVAPIMLVVVLMGLFAPFILIGLVIQSRRETRTEPTPHD